MKHIRKSTWVIILFALAASYLSFSGGGWKQKQVLKWDASGYYLFLPAAFIYQDLGTLSFYTHIDSVYQPSGDIRDYALYDHAATGRRSDKYAIGVALAELPLFSVAHAYTLLSQQSPPDGYSEPYQLSVSVSNILWSVLGLLVLGTFLRRYFTDTVTALTLLLIGLGTNFFCYTAWIPGMSHNLVFLLFACVLYFTERWYARPRLSYAALLGFFLGWVLITRPVDIIIVLIPLLWPLPATIAGSRILAWRRHKLHLLACAACLLLVCSLQLAYWKYVTGQFIHFSYVDEGFLFSEPEILKGLFSFRKGWFVYTPLAFAACLGLIPLYIRQPRVAMLLFSFLLLNLYLVFSWKVWWYGWGFGCRALIETLALMSIPLAALVNRLGSGRRSIKAAGIGLGLLLLGLNLFQTRQFIRGVLPGDYMDRAHYWDIWGKMRPRDESAKYFRP